jgi:spore coat polysaccharide biosynthesis protein SpsF
MGSSRLPGKILKPILDKPMLARMIERVRASKHIQGIVVATTNAKADDATEAFCQANSIACYRGSEIDVLDRVLQAARFMDADWIVQLTGDCPFIDGRLLDEPIQICLSQSDSWDFFSSPLDDSGLPRGTGLRMFP